MVSEYPVILRTNMGSRYSSGGGSALLTDPYLVQRQPCLWYKSGKTTQEVRRQNNIFTRIDVLFGEGRTRYGHENLVPPVSQKE